MPGTGLGRSYETFEKRSILFKIKEDENFNHPAQDAKRQRHHTLKYFED